MVILAIIVFIVMATLAIIVFHCIGNIDNYYIILYWQYWQLLYYIVLAILANIVFYFIGNIGNYCIILYWQYWQLLYYIVLTILALYCFGHIGNYCVRGRVAARSDPGKARVNEETQDSWVTEIYQVPLITHRLRLRDNR